MQSIVVEGQTGRSQIMVGESLAHLSDHLPPGRTKINCTAPSTQPGRYYWYSRMFMRKNDDGSWYQE